MNKHEQALETDTLRLGSPAAAAASSTSARGWSSGESTAGVGAGARLRSGLMTVEVEVTVEDGTVVISVIVARTEVSVIDAVLRTNPVSQTRSSVPVCATSLPDRSRSRFVLCDQRYCKEGTTVGSRQRGLGLKTF